MKHSVRRTVPLTNLLSVTSVGLCSDLMQFSPALGD